MRGVAVSSILPKIYDIMLDNRFKEWYKINPEQAGFREKQGCLIQIFSIYLMNELAKSLNEVPAATARPNLFISELGSA